MQWHVYLCGTHRFLFRASTSLVVTLESVSSWRNAISHFSLQINWHVNEHCSENTCYKWLWNHLYTMCHPFMHGYHSIQVNDKHIYIIIIPPHSASGKACSCAYVHISKCLVGKGKTTASCSASCSGRCAHYSKCASWYKKNTTSASCRWCPLQVQVSCLR